MKPTMRKNELEMSQVPLLISQIKRFRNESLLNTLDEEAFLRSTLRNIKAAVCREAPHDYWRMGESGYCLGRFEMDSDGTLVYTAYQLFIEPSARSWATVREVVKFLKFYAQKHRCSRLLIMSSRLDHIAAYKRGLGNDFKIRNVIFEKEL